MNPTDPVNLTPIVISCLNWKEKYEDRTKSWKFGTFVAFVFFEPVEVYIFGCIITYVLKLTQSPILSLEHVTGSSVHP